jgi:hypothetical protein
MMNCDDEADGQHLMRVLLLVLAQYSFGWHRTGNLGGTNWKVGWFCICMAGEKRCVELFRSFSYLALPV